MTQPPVSSSMRKGTRSCIECRRRKLRCSWTSDTSQSCRRCEERNLVCVPQTRTSVSTVAAKQRSGDRLTHVEAELLQIKGALRTVEAKLNIPHSSLLEHTPQPPSSVGTLQEPSGVDTSEDDDTSEKDEILIDDSNSRMRNLFQNEWLSTDDPYATHPTQTKAKKSGSYLLAKARTVLQTLIPSIEDVRILADHVTVWSEIAEEMFPPLSENLVPTAQSKQQIMSQYPQIRQPDADTWMLAQWLLALAMTAQQMPHEEEQSTDLIKTVERRYAFAEMLTKAVEQTLLSHESLLGTPRGLETAMQFLRLSVTRGGIQRTWLYLRRVVAIAELMGLPRSAKANQAQVARGRPGTMEDSNKTRLWAELCIVDRITGILHNMPIATRAYPVPVFLPPRFDGTIQPLDYVLQLSSILVEVQDLDDARALQTSDNDIYHAVLKLDGHLRALGSTMPTTWITGGQPQSTAGQILCFVHHCTVMQTHLHFVLRDDPTKQYTYSKIAGRKACQDVARQWLRLRRLLPSGFFLCRVLDVQAFTATVVLMLVSYSSGRNSASAFDASSADIGPLLTETFNLLEERSKDRISSDFTRQAVDTLHSLSSLLGGHDEASSPELTLKVPLLGRLHVRRRSREQAMNAGAVSTTFDQPSSTSAMQQFNIQNTYSTLDGSNITAPGMNQSNNALSWLVEDDYNNLFQNYLMADSTNPTWQLQSDLGATY